MTGRIVLIGVALVAGLGLTSMAQQQGQALPGPGSGVLTVRGTVDIGNAPAVSAVQAGRWTVEVANSPAVRIETMPAVTLAPAAFVQAGTSYLITWSTGESETVAVTETGPGGWVKVAADRWINLSAARSLARR